MKTSGQLWHKPYIGEWSYKLVKHCIFGPIRVKCMVTPSKAQFEVTKSDLNVKVLEFISALQCLNFCNVHNKCDLFKKIASLALVVGSEWLSAVPVRCSWQDSSDYVTEISCKVCRRIQQSVKQLQECCAPHLISEKEIKTMSQTHTVSSSFAFSIQFNISLFPELVCSCRPV